MAKLSDITINVSCNCENFKEEEPVKDTASEAMEEIRVAVDGAAWKLEINKWLDIVEQKLKAKDEEIKEQKEKIRELYELLGIHGLGGIKGIKEDHAKEIKELTNDKEAFRLTYCEVFNERNKLKFENGELRGLLGRINEFVKLDGGA